MATSKWYMRCYPAGNSVVGQFGVKYAWRNKFRPTIPFSVGLNLFGLLQTDPLPEIQLTVLYPSAMVSPGVRE